MCDSFDTFARVQQLLASWARGGTDEQRELAIYMLAQTNVAVQDGESVEDILNLLDGSSNRFIAAAMELKTAIQDVPAYIDPEELFDLLRAFTLDVYAFYNIPPKSDGENNYGPYAVGCPTGHVLHYTASPNSSVGRLKTLLKRFAVDSTSKVGANFIVFDGLQPELADIRARYPALYGPVGAFKVDVLYMGMLAFWASNWANRYTLSTENRNVGRVYTADGVTFYWGGAKYIGNPSYLYTGRTPVEVRGMWCEPFTDDQIRANEYLCRKTCEWMEGRFDPLNFLSHHDIGSSKWDIWPQFPFGRMKDAICDSAPLDLEGYLEELNRLRCSSVTDDATAEEFLTVFGYLTTNWRELADSDVLAVWSDAVKNLQRKKDIKVDGIMGPKTREAMNQCRSAYKLNG